MATTNPTPRPLYKVDLRMTPLREVCGNFQTTIYVNVTALAGDLSDAKVLRVFIEGGMFFWDASIKKGLAKFRLKQLEPRAEPYLIEVMIPGTECGATCQIMVPLPPVPEPPPPPPALVEEIPTTMKVRVKNLQLPVGVAMGPNKAYVAVFNQDGKLITAPVMVWLYVGGGRIGSAETSDGQAEIDIPVCGEGMHAVAAEVDLKCKDQTTFMVTVIPPAPLPFVPKATTMEVFAADVTLPVGTLQGSTEIFARVYDQNGELMSVDVDVQVLVANGNVGTIHAHNGVGQLTTPDYGVGSYEVIVGVSMSCKDKKTFNVTETLAPASPSPPARTAVPVQIINDSKLWLGAGRFICALRVVDVDGKPIEGVPVAVNDCVGGALMDLGLTDPNGMVLWDYTMTPAEHTNLFTAFCRSKSSVETPINLYWPGVLPAPTTAPVALP